MAKLAQNFAKYMVVARLNATGLIEKPDIIGAVFGQTEGLLGQDLDLRELQKTGRIGRIEVRIKAMGGKSQAEITIPSSLDISETALIAASLETIEKVGPCDAQIEIVKVDDVRSQKRKYVIDRAKDILRAMVSTDALPDTQRLTEQIKESIRTAEVASYEGLACGPDVISGDEIIVVEGRADVLTMLRHGIRNCIACEGSKVPEALGKITREKETTVLLDGDRGGDLILKKLSAVAHIDFVARAPEGKEVEELWKKEIFKSLREKVPYDQYLTGQAGTITSTNGHKIESKVSATEISADQAATLANLSDDLIGTRATYLLDNNFQVVSKIPLSEASLVLGDYDNVYALVADSKVNQALIDLAELHNVKILVGSGVSESLAAHSVKVLTPEKLKVMV